MGISIAMAKEALLKRNRTAGVVSESFPGRPSKRRLTPGEKGEIEARKYAEEMFLLFHGEKK